MIKLPTRSIKARKKNKLLKERSVKENLLKLENTVRNTFDDGRIVIHRSSKSKFTSKSSKSGRRSTYIGVSRNGDVWQSLIMIDGKKTYIGSYLSEEEAAMSYDFYSIILKSFSAKTNFDYSIENIKRMLEDYHQNGEEFAPINLLN